MKSGDGYYHTMCNLVVYCVARDAWFRFSFHPYQSNVESPLYYFIKSFNCKFVCIASLVTQLTV